MNTPMTRNLRRLTRGADGGRRVARCRLMRAAFGAAVPEVLMPLLQGANTRPPRAQREDGVARRRRRRQRGRIRHPIRNRRLPKRVVVTLCVLAEWRVDQ